MEVHSYPWTLTTRCTCWAPSLFACMLVVGQLLCSEVGAQTATPTPGGECCEAHEGPGCDDGACQNCVCTFDSDCCSVTGWDAVCAAEAGDICAASCPCVLPVTATPTVTPTAGGDCCAAHGGPECDVPECEACVCNLDVICCSTTWDAFCASQAAEECAGICPCEPVPTATPTVAPTPGGDCCAEHAGPGCDDVMCQTCVCDLDAECCSEIGWDATCVQEATVECAASCTCDIAGDCCESHGGIGCDDTRCQECVCTLDRDCCSEIGWDGTCVDEATIECAASCTCCVGDCGRNGEVTVNELILAVNIALGNAPVDGCPAVDSNEDGQVSVNELIQAVNSALRGCGA